MKINLSGKTAVVTASTGGIGQAAAKGLAGCGAAIVINGRNADTVAATVERIGAAVPGAQVSGVVADLATAAGCAELLAAVPTTDILVNSLGIHEPRDFFDIGDDDWLRLFQANVLSGARLARGYMPAMLQRNWGRIVFVCSEAALWIPKEMIHYGATKVAQLGVSRGLAELTAGTGVTVNSVLPGPTEAARSPGGDELLRSMGFEPSRPLEEIGREIVARVRPTSLLQRLAKPEEVANMIVYLCSRESSATNGAALRVEGGILREIA